MPPSLWGKCGQQVTPLPRSSTTIEFVKFTSNVFAAQWLTIKGFSSIMQRPFLRPTNLMVLSQVVLHPVLAISLLGGSAARHQTLELNSIPFMALRCLLLSTTYLGSTCSFHPSIDIPHMILIIIRVPNCSIIALYHPPSP